GGCGRGGRLGGQFGRGFRRCEPDGAATRATHGATGGTERGRRQCERGRAARTNNKHGDSRRFRRHPNHRSLTDRKPCEAPLRLAIAARAGTQQLGKPSVFLYKANRGIGAPVGACGGRVVRFENVGLRYGLGPEVLRDLTFRIEPHSFQFLTGPSGAGKTSLLRLLFLSMRPTRGLISLFGHDLASLSK